MSWILTCYFNNNIQLGFGESLDKSWQEKNEFCAIDLI